MLRAILVGIDPSEEMRTMASDANMFAIAAGHVRLLPGDGTQSPTPTASPVRTACTRSTSSGTNRSGSCASCDASCARVLAS
ncbi:MAG: hypothetical protein KIT14_11010 [bacterium]|nr:hypothetical protein [bacterium]